MAGTRDVKVAFLGDVSKLNAELEEMAAQVRESTAKVEAAAKDMGESFDRAEGSMRGMRDRLDSVGESGGSAEQGMRGLSDVTNFMGDQFGVSLGPVGEMSAGLADLGGGIEGLLKGFPALVGGMAPAIASTWAYVTALYAQAAAFIVANAPLLLIIGILAAVGAAIYLLVDNWGAVQGAMETLWGWVTSTWSGFTALVTGPMDAVIGWVTDTWSTVSGAVTGAFDAAITWIDETFQPAVDRITGAFQRVLTWLGDTWSTVSGAVTGAFEAAITWIDDTFQPAVDRITGAFQAVLDFLGGAWTTVTELVSGPLNAVKTWLTDELWGFISDTVPGWFSDMASKIGGFVSGGFTTAANAIIDIINSMINLVNKISIPGISIPDWVPGLGGKGWGGWSPNIPTIPRLALGGIVRRPTLALIGEAGPEAVVPLRGMRGASAMREAGGGGDVINVYVQGSVWTTGELARELDLHLRRTGKPGILARS